MNVTVIIPLLLALAVSQCGEARGEGSASFAALARVEDTTAVRFVVRSDDTVRAPGRALLPVETIDETLIPSTGRVVPVAAGQNLQRAIDAARPGDILELARGASFRGPFVLRKKNMMGGWITIRSQSAGTAPSPGTRIRPAQAAGLAKLLTSDKGQSFVNEGVVNTEPGAHNYRLSLLEITVPANEKRANALVSLGMANETSRAQLPYNFVLDRVYIHGQADTDLRRCIALNGGATAIVDSWISDCHGRGADTQAIGGWSGTGPYKIVNNYLEGAGQNIMFGGADPRIPNVVPSDIEIRRNHLFKPVAWKGAWSIKNLFELKQGIRVLVEGNVLENNWVDGQAGAAVLLYSVNQDGSAPWSEVRDVTYRYNVLRNSPQALNLAATWTGQPAVAMSHVYIGHNLFENISGRFAMVDGVRNLTYEHNTGLGVTHGIILHGRKGSNLVIQNNILGTTQANWGTWDFAVSQDGAGFGTSALTNLYGNSWTFRGNILPGVTGGSFPPGNANPPSPAAIGFTSYPTDLRLATSSRFRTASTSSASPGVDHAELTRQIAGVVTPP